MSYIVVANVDVTDEDNAGADKTAVEARILAERNGEITFDVSGDHQRKKELTLQMATTLINAGFYCFEIHHSY